MKIHLRRVVSTHKLTFEEFTTILTQIKSCLISCPQYHFSVMKTASKP